MAAHALVGSIGKAVVALRGVAIAHQLNIGAKLAERFVIEKSYRLALLLAVIGQRGVGLGDIHRQRAQIAHIFPDAQVKGTIAVCQLGTAIKRPPCR